MIKPLRMSPNIRLRHTLDYEIDLDKDQEVFNKELYSKYVGMHAEALKRQSSVINRLAFTDVILFLFLSDVEVVIPGLNYNLFDVPGGQTILAVYVSLSFLFLCIAFSNAQLYEAISQVLARRLNPDRIDPEFVTAADTYSQLFLKVMRRDLHSAGRDPFDVGRGFQIYYGIAMYLAVALTMLLVLAHFALVTLALWPIQWNSVGFLFALVVSLLANICGLMIAVELRFDVHPRASDKS